jgi:hypothetical protein
MKNACSSLGLIVALSALLLTSCATGPQTPYKAPTIAINTIPSGADISINGNYRGTSPLEIPMPASRIDKGAYYAMEYRADQPLQIEAQLAGFQSKTVAFGVFHASEDKVIQPVFSASAVTKTTPGYYTFEKQITIKLAPATAK